MIKKAQSKRLIALSEKATDLFVELEGIAEEIGHVVSEMRDAFDDKSERWQDSERGETTSEFIDAWDDYLQELQGIEPGVPPESPEY